MVILYSHSIRNIINGYFLGIMTQCVNYSELLSDETSRIDYCRNLIRKINFKNEGINIKLDFSDVWRNKKSPDDSYMYFGAVLTSSIDVSRQYSTLAGMKVYFYYSEINNRRF